MEKIASAITLSAIQVQCRLILWLAQSLLWQDRSEILNLIPFNFFPYVRSEFSLRR